MNHPLGDDLLAKIDQQRVLRGFMPISEMLALMTERGSVVLDPFSTLISRGVVIGTGNFLYPNVILQVTNSGSLIVGNDNVLHPGAKLHADSGSITIGDDNEFGDGGVRIKASEIDALIKIGNRGRYMSGAEIVGTCSLGSGSQILGAISAQNCTLEAGHSYKEPDAEKRGGVLKGFGVARNLVVGRGEVLNGRGVFEQSMIEQQIAYHPRKA